MCSLALILLLLCSYGMWEGVCRFPGIHAQREQIRDPEGMPVKLGFSRVERVLGEGRFLLVVMYGEEVELRAPGADFRKGQVVSVAGRLLPQGFVVADSCTLHRWRWLKKLVSLAGAVLVLGLCWRRYRFSWKSLALTERGSCPT